MSTPSPHRRTRGLPWSLVAGAFLVAVLIIGIAATAMDEQSGSAASQGGSPTTGGVSDEMRELGERLAHRDSDDPMALGDVDAPVVLIAWSDYQCPFCGTWVRETQPELVDRYVSSGKLRIEWREFPYMGEASQTMAVGGRAAAEQEMFWEYHEAVYDSQDELTGADSELEETLADLAADAGMDRARFVEDLESEKLATEVEEDFTQGQELGVSGTPTFFINGAPVTGAQPLSVFTDSIDDALADAGN